MGMYALYAAGSRQATGDKAQATSHKQQAGHMRQAISYKPQATSFIREEENNIINKRMENKKIIE